MGRLLRAPPAGSASKRPAPQPRPQPRPQPGLRPYIPPFPLPPSTLRPPAGRISILIESLIATMEREEKQSEQKTGKRKDVPVGLRVGRQGGGGGD